VVCEHEKEIGEVTVKICLIGSMRFLSQKRNIAEYLESLGHEVQYSNKDAHNMTPFKQWKLELMKEHVKRIEWADTVLIINLPAEMDFDYWIESYIGGNTLGEIFIAWYLSKNLYSWLMIPERHRYFEELNPMDIKLWEPRDFCKHPNEKYRKILMNYEICEICGNVKDIK
jgi:hypothetical protein